MKNKKLFLASLVLLAILAIGAVSASEDIADDTSVTSVSEDGISEDSLTVSEEGADIEEAPVLNSPSTNDGDDSIESINDEIILGEDDGEGDEESPYYIYVEDNKEFITDTDDDNYVGDAIVAGIILPNDTEDGHMDVFTDDDVELARIGVEAAGEGSWHIDENGNLKACLYLKDLNLIGVNNGDNVNFIFFDADGKKSLSTSRTIEITDSYIRFIDENSGDEGGDADDGVVIYVPNGEDRQFNIVDDLEVPFAFISVSNEFPQANVIRMWNANHENYEDFIYFEEPLSQLIGEPDEENEGFTLYSISLSDFRDGGLDNLLETRYLKIEFIDVDENEDYTEIDSRSYFVEYNDEDNTIMFWEDDEEEEEDGVEFELDTETEFSTSEEDPDAVFANVTVRGWTDGYVVIVDDNDNEIFRKALFDFNQDYVDGNTYKIALYEDNGNFIFENYRDDGYFRLKFLNEDWDEIAGIDCLIFFGEDTVRFEYDPHNPGDHISIDVDQDDHSITDDGDFVWINLPSDITQGTVMVISGGNTMLDAPISDEEGSHWWKEIDGHYVCSFAPCHLDWDNVNDGDIVLIAFLDENDNIVESRDYTVYIDDDLFRFEEIKHIEISIWDEDDERGTLYTDSQGWVVSVHVPEGFEGTIYVFANDTEKASWEIEFDEDNEWTYTDWDLESLDLRAPGIYNIVVKLDDEPLLEETINVVEFAYDEFRAIFDYGEDEGDESLRLFIPDGSTGTVKILVEKELENGRCETVFEDSFEISSEDFGDWMIWYVEDIGFERNGEYYTFTLEVEQDDAVVYRYKNGHSSGDDGGDDDEFIYINDEEIITDPNSDDYNPDATIATVVNGVYKVVITTASGDELKTIEIGNDYWETDEQYYIELNEILDMLNQIQDNDVILFRSYNDLDEELCTPVSCQAKVTDGAIQFEPMRIIDQYIDYEPNGDMEIIYINVPSSTFDKKNDTSFIIQYKVPNVPGSTISLNIESYGFGEWFDISGEGEIDIAKYLFKCKPGKNWLDFYCEIYFRYAGFEYCYDDWIGFPVVIIEDSGDLEKLDTILNVDAVTVDAGTSATLTATLKDEAGKLLAGKEITFEVNNKKYTAKTNANGVATVKIDALSAGKYAVYASFNGDDDYLDCDYTSSLTVNSVPDKKISLTITPTALTTTYNSGKTFNIKVVDASGKAVSGVKLTLKVYTGSKYKTVTVTTNAKGIASYKASTLALGKHKVTVSLADNKYQASAKTSSIKINKAKTTVKAPKVTGKFKKSKFFKVTIKNKATKKAVSKIKVKIKVFTGKKSKTYTVKTNKKGIAKFNIKKLKKGTHKVVISSGNKNYIISKKSSIKIK